MPTLTQPAGQVKFTNVAIVRYKKAGKRFEIAAYKNKVLNWRAKIETDINEVLQIDKVFSNVSKGILANGKDMKEALGTDDHFKAALIVLERGELEVGEKERQHMFDTLFRDIATIVADKCVNPESGRPYTVTLIERALQDAHFAVNPTKSAKQQALKAIEVLRKFMPIERASMKLRLSAPCGPLATTARSALVAMGCVIETERGTAAGTSSGGSGSETYAVEFFIDPGLYRRVEEMAATLSGRQLGSRPGGDGGEEGGAAKGNEESEDEDDDGGAPHVAVSLPAGAAPAPVTVEVLSLAVAASEEGGSAALRAAAAAGSRSEGGGSSAGAAKTGGKKAKASGKGSKGGVGSSGAGKGDDSGSDSDGYIPMPEQGKGGRRGRLRALSSSSSSSSEESEEEHAPATKAHASLVPVAPALAPVAAAPAASAFGGVDSATAAASRGTGMAVARTVVQPSASRLVCNSCAGLAFESADAHRAHFRSDLHRFNLKRKMKAMAPVTEAEYSALPPKERDAFLNAME